MNTQLQQNGYPLPQSEESRTRPSRFEGADQEAALGLLVAAGHLRKHYGEVCGQFGVTHEQYNVLRILRGVYPEGYSRQEITDRLIERSPDVTRLIDRLERNGLVERYRSTDDRRLSLTRISRMGLVLLEQMDEPLRAAQRAYMYALSEGDLAQLARLCGALGHTS
jgi:DNA-binding MarR family transcriptional regulator